MRKKLIVIVGPTGSGKTALSLELARRFRCEIVSSDSRQIFRRMDIGTAKPTAQELATAPHHMISTRDITEPYNAGDYERDAIEIISKLHEMSDYVILVGGSGLYVNAVCNGMDDLPDSDPQIRQSLNEQVQKGELEKLTQQLKQLDPEYYEVVDKKNPNRVVRALEVCMTSGKRYSELRNGAGKERDFEVIKIGVDVPRDVLYDRIDRRVDMMIDDGLVEEVRSLMSLRGNNALNSVGYSELFDFFDGKIVENEAIELIKRNSRRYAKRQLTWFRRDTSTVWFSPSDIENVEKYIKNH